MGTEKPASSSAGFCSSSTHREEATQSSECHAAPPAQKDPGGAAPCPGPGGLPRAPGPHPRELGAAPLCQPGSVNRGRSKTGAVQQQQQRRQGRAPRLRPCRGEETSGPRALPGRSGPRTAAAGDRPGTSRGPPGDLRGPPAPPRAAPAPHPPPPDAALAKQRPRPGEPRGLGPAPLCHRSQSAGPAHPPQPIREPRCAGTANPRAPPCPRPPPPAVPQMMGPNCDFPVTPHGSTAPGPPTERDRESERLRGACGVREIGG
ncbi:basic proline-rich protein-like [Chiroxiphia lanceolata]|uniref:basic proline-rich protein-like n=1 Tax=Chiroxiphia lanceolata TaxID=296741 RepID=UPI0013CECF72|nr:basic proline-rich protein-like [Chiroxiphia lanceolata]